MRRKRVFGASRVQVEEMEDELVASLLEED